MEASRRLLKSRDLTSLDDADSSLQLRSFAQRIEEYYGLEDAAQPVASDGAASVCAAIDFKNAALLQSCLTEMGGIPSRLETGLSKKMQRKLAKEIKKCRY